MVALKPDLPTPQKDRFTTRTANSGLGSAFSRPQKGARYLNPQTGLWLSADPAMGEYVPQAPINDEAKKANGNLPGMGGVFNVVNLHVYHYAGNNPVRYVDPTGMGDELPDTKPSDKNQGTGYNIGKSEFSHFRFYQLKVQELAVLSLSKARLIFQYFA